jgi:hypothetical protein
MGIPSNDFAAPRGDSFSFTTIGDTVEGVIVYAPSKWEERTNKFNGNKEHVMRIGIDTGNGEPTYIWPVQGGTMAQAIAEASRAANIDEVDVGQRIKLGFTSTKDTGKPQPLKLYSCRLEPGTAAVVGDVEEPF